MKGDSKDLLALKILAAVFVASVFVQDLTDNEVANGLSTAVGVACLAGIFVNAATIIVRNQPVMLIIALLSVLALAAPALAGEAGDPQESTRETPTATLDIFLLLLLVGVICVIIIAGKRRHRTDSGSGAQKRPVHAPRVHDLYGKGGGSQGHTWE